MASPPGLPIRPSYKPIAPKFAGGNGDAGSQTPKVTTPKPSALPAGPVKDLGFWGTIKEMRIQLKNDAKARDVVKALALKYLPDLTMSGFFAIPVVGWAAGLIAIPLNMFLTDKGREKLAIAKNGLKRKLGEPTHDGLHHALKLESDDPRLINIWASENRYFGKPKAGSKQPPHELADYVAIKFNKALKGIFHNSPSLQKKFRINHEGESFAFKMLQRFIHARQSLRQTPFLGWIFNKMSGLSQNRLQGAVPKHKLVQLLLLLPRMGLLGVYMLIAKKPNPKAFKDFVKP